MADQDLPILYSFRRCPYAMRGRLGLAIAGITCELREVKLSNKPDAMLTISPKGTVPVLQLADATVIDESIDVMRWALAQNDPEGWLERDDAELIARNDGPFKHDLDRYKYPNRHDSEPLEHRESAMQFLGQLDERLAEQGQLCGAVRGIADCAIFPFVRQFAAVDREWWETTPIPHVRKWLEGHLASDLFKGIMTKYVPWQEGDEIVMFGEAV